MLEITFAKWQLPDKTFLPAAPTIRTVAGPPGVTVIVQMAWRHDCPQGRSFYFQGFARVRRILTTGETDHRLLHFTAVPCPYGPRVHIKVDWTFGLGTPQDDDFEGEWHGPCCVPFPRDDDEYGGNLVHDLRDLVTRARRAFEDHNAGAGDDCSSAVGGDEA